jgi:3-oxoadipate enol-lactonase/4-carboxymuconolactone decarboxylase
VIPFHRLDGPAEAPVLVLCNSLGTSAAMWEPQLPALASRFRVVRYELRGHGGTSPPAPGPYSIEDLGSDVIDLLDYLGVERTSMCGVSLGGMIALWVAVHRPERVERLVLACTAAELGPLEDWEDRAAKVRTAQSVSILREALLSRWFTPGFLEGRPDIAMAVTEMLDAADPEAYAGCCEAIGAMDQRPDLVAVRAPTLVVSGAADRVTPPIRGLELQAGIPGAAFAVMSGASHLVNVEQPESFTDAVIDHLAGRSVERGDVMRRRVLGDDYVDYSAARSTSLSTPFTDFITRAVWGEIWTRPALDLRTRSCLTVALLAALGRLHELKLHVAGARRVGLSNEEISEVLLHTAVYAGVPAANAALHLAAEVLQSDD